MPKTNTDYLKINASSMADFLKQKLSQDSSFTDQVYSGSNLSILVEGFAYMYENLMFYLNTSATEAMFTDAQLYENMNRIVKMLGYSPGGHTSPRATLVVANKDQTNLSGIYGNSDTRKILSSFTSIDTGKKDVSGKSLYYSFLSDVQIDNFTSVDALEPSKIEAANGKWKVYPTTLTSAGAASEVFILSRIDLSSMKADHTSVIAFVKTFSDGVQTYDRYTPIPDGTAFGTTSYVTGPETQMFEFRINEDKRYELTFGDGIHGKQLKAGDEIYFVYLESNGDEGQIGYGAIGEKSTITTGIDGLTQDLFYKFLGETPTSYSDKYLSPQEVAGIYFTNILTASPYKGMETVDEIRDNAPFWARTNGKLLSEDDFKQYVIISHSGLVYDVYVQNNTSYMNSFMKWLSDYDRLNQNVRSFGYNYASACDFNNVYLWYKQKYDFDRSRLIKDLQGRKVLTSEPILLSCLDTVFVPMFEYEYGEDGNTVIYEPRAAGAAYPSGVKPGKTSGTWQDVYVNMVDPDLTNWIEIIKDSSSQVSTERLKATVIQTITDFFSPKANRLGQRMDFTVLYNTLVNIQGIKHVRMAFLPPGGKPSETRYYNGLSFAALTASVLRGRDFTTVSGVFDLQPFCFPVLGQSSTLGNRIKILSENLSRSPMGY